MRLIRPVLLSLPLLVPADAMVQTLPGGTIHFAWDDCYGGGGAANKAWVCDSNVGAPFTLYASVVPPPGLTQYVGHLAVFDLWSSTSLMPNWWRFSFAGCRLSSSLTAVPALGATTCPDVISHPQFGGIDYAFPFGDGNLTRLRTAYAVESHLAGPLGSTEELTALAISIDRRRTTGTPICTGCSVPLCIEFKSVLLDQLDPNLPKGLVTTGEQRYVSWNGPAPNTPCPASTPVESRTWGQVKSLYR